MTSSDWRFVLPGDTEDATSDAVVFEPPARRTLGWIDRRLAADGLRRVGVWWVRGRRGAPDAYVPLDHAGATRWYALRHLRPGARRTTLLLAVRLGLRTAVLVAGPPAVVAVRRDAPTSAGAVGVLSADLPVTVAPVGGRPVVLTPGESHNRVVVLPFAPRAQRPTAVVKLCRTPDRNERTEHEQAQLPLLRAGLPRPIAERLPEPLGTSTWRGLTLGIESYVDGEPVDQLLSRRRGRADHLQRALDVVVDWLIEFTVHAPLTSTSWAAERRAWVDTPLDELVERSPGRRAALEGVRRTVDRWADRPVASVTVHWGFRGRNLLLGADGVAVIDWEGASPGPPLYDLLFFLGEWLAATAGPSLADVVTGHGDGGPARASRAAIERYCDCVGIEDDTVAVLAALHAVERALGRFRRGGDPEPYLTELDAILAAR